MAIVLPGKFIYLATMATGSERVAAGLKRIEGAFAAYDKRQGIGHHATLDQVRTVCGDQLTKSEVIFTTIRNPYDMLVTWFLRNRDHFQMRRLKETLKREPTFQEFIDVWLQFDAEPKLRCRPYMVEGRIFYQAMTCSQVVRYENLQAELDGVMRKIPGVPGSVLLAPEQPDPGRDHWSLYYDDATYAYVNEYFQAEFVQFGYPFLWSNNSLA